MGCGSGRIPGWTPDTHHLAAAPGVGLSSPPSSGGGRGTLKVVAASQNIGRSGGGICTEVLPPQSRSERPFRPSLLQGSAHGPQEQAGSNGSWPWLLATRRLPGTSPSPDLQDRSATLATQTTARADSTGCTLGLLPATPIFQGREAEPPSVAPASIQQGSRRLSAQGFWGSISSKCCCGQLQGARLSHEAPSPSWLT